MIPAEAGNVFPWLTQRVRRLCDETRLRNVWRIDEDQPSQSSRNELLGLAAGSPARYALRVELLDPASANRLLPDRQFDKESASRSSRANPDRRSPLNRPSPSR